MKVVTNHCFGGFSISAKAQGDMHCEHERNTYESHRADELRNCPELVRVVEKFGPAASGRCAKLRITEIPDDVDFEIDEYDGMEHVAEKHRTWY